jgi:pseudaminic acid cytidylyltransferase
VKKNEENSSMKVAIIPARGGSKRIPKKNIKDFLGKPIIAYSIETALNSGLFDEVFVSTDDNEIAAIAQKYGAKVPVLRSEKNSDDFATTSDLLLEVLEYYQTQNITVDSFCCIYATSPLIQIVDLKAANDLFDTDNFDTVMSAVAFSFPPQRSFQLLENNQIELNFPNEIGKRSQDLKSFYHDAGMFYFCKTNSFLASKNIWYGKIGAFCLDEMKVQDIDTETDWKLAELKYQLAKN